MNRRSAVVAVVLAVAVAMLTAWCDRGNSHDVIWPAVFTLFAIGFAALICVIVIDTWRDRELDRAERRQHLAGGALWSEKDIMG